MMAMLRTLKRQHLMFGMYACIPEKTITARHSRPGLSLPVMPGIPEQAVTTHCGRPRLLPWLLRLPRAEHGCAGRTVQTDQRVVGGCGVGGDAWVGERQGVDGQVWRGRPVKQVLVTIWNKYG